VASFLVIRPFLPAAVWPTTLVIATWPLLLSVQVRLNGPRGLTVTVMTLVLSLVVLVPWLFAVSAVVSRSDRVVALVSVLPNLRFPTPRNWMSGVPVLGKPLSSRWQRLADGSTADTLQRARPYG
jgi:predicted PurR-regulated permease PerM